jgi:hypothetical protein
MDHRSTVKPDRQVDDTQREEAISRDSRDRVALPAISDATRSAIASLVSVGES